MSYGIFPEQKHDEAFMQTYRDFANRFYQTYLNQSKFLKNPDYAVYRPNDLSERFLIYLPNPDHSNFFVNKTDLFIIYVDFISSMQAVLSSNGNVIQSTRVQAKHLTFDYDSDDARRLKKARTERYQLEYDKLPQGLFRVNDVRSDGKFAGYNSACVFQLQPEHYHYFEPYFKDFVPFQRALLKHQFDTLTPATLPKNLLN